MERTNIKYRVIYFGSLFEVKASQQVFSSYNEAHDYIAEHLLGNFEHHTVMSESEVIDQGIPLTSNFPRKKLTKYTYPLGLSSTQKHYYRITLNRKRKHGKGLITIPYILPSGRKSLTIKAAMQDSRTREDYNKCFWLNRLGPNILFLLLDRDFRELNTQYIWGTAYCSELNLKKQTIRHSHIIFFHGDEPIPITLISFYQKLIALYKAKGTNKAFQELGFK